MKTVYTAKQHLHELDGRYHFGTEGEHDVEWPLIDDGTIERMAEKYDVHPGLVKDIAEAFQYAAEQTVELIGKDLEDIWRRLDEAGL